MAKPSLLDQIASGTDALPDPLTAGPATKPKKSLLDEIANGTDALPDPLEEEMAAKDFTSTIEPPMGTTDPALLRMAELRGKVLRAGQKCPPGIDCSRYTSTVLGRLGSKVNGSAVQQYHKTERVNLPNLTPGDLVFFDNGMRDTYNTVGKRVGNRFVNHVGIYIGEGKFIQDPGKGSDRRRGEPIDLAQYVRDLKANNPRAAFMGGGRVSDLHQQPAPQRPGGTLPPPAPLPGQQPLIQPGLGQQMQEQLVTNPLPGIADSEAALAAKAGQIQPNTTATINSPVGPITITEYPGVGYEADIPGVGKVNGKNYAAVSKNALKQAKINAEQAATVKGHPNEAAYIPSSDVRPPNVNLGQEGTLGAGINNKHLTDKQKYEGAMAEIDKVGAWMADQLKQMTPEAGLIKIADETGIPVPAAARALATAMPDAAGNMTGQFAMSPIRWAAKSMVLGSDEYSTQEKLETAAGLLLEAATTNIGLTGRSAMDSAFEWAAKKFGSPEKFKAALDKLKLEPNQRAMIEAGIDTYTGPGTIGPARKAIKGVDNEADVARGFVRDADAAKRSKNATRGKTELQPTTDADVLMARARGEKEPPGAGRRTADQDILRMGRGQTGAKPATPSQWKWPSTVADTAAKEAGLGGAGGAQAEAATTGGSGAAAGGARETAQEAGIRGLHLSNDPGITHLDPERLGTGPNATINDKSATVKGTWIYPAGAQVERAVANSTKHAYEVDFKPGEIYDLAKDPQGLLKSTAEETGLREQGLMDAINKKLKDQGFKGVSMDRDGQPFRIFSFDKVETTPSIHPGPVGKSKGPLAKSALSDLEAGIHNTLNVPVEKDGGGWTFNPHKWFARHDTPGFTVGGVVPSKIVKDSELTPQLIKKFADDNAELLRDPTRRVGLWKDPDSKDVYIDVVDIMDDKEKALVTAEARGEKAIGRFDENGRYAEEIPLPKKAETPAGKPAQGKLDFGPDSDVPQFVKDIVREGDEARARLKAGPAAYQDPKTLIRNSKQGGAARLPVNPKRLQDLAIVAAADIVKSGYATARVAKALVEKYGVSLADAKKAVELGLERLAAPIKKHFGSAHDAITLAKAAEYMALMPPVERYVTAALAGRAKRGWYREASVMLREMFGDDTLVFTRILGATSPLQSVRENMEMALKVYEEWIKRGKPTALADVEKMFRLKSGSGKSYELVNLGSRRGGSVQALMGQELNGFKVNAFIANLTGDLTRVTNDTWMAQFAEVAQSIFGTKSGYVGGEAVVKEAAEQISKITGEAWEPAEVQETVWSIMKHLREKGRGDATTLIKSLSHEELSMVEDFSNVMNSEKIQRMLGRLGIDPELVNKFKQPSKESGKLAEDALINQKNLSDIAGTADKRNGRYDIADLIASDFAEPDEIAKYGLNKSEVAQVKKIVDKAGGIDNIKGQGGDKDAKEALRKIFDEAETRPKKAAYVKALQDTAKPANTRLAAARKRWEGGLSSYKSKPKTLAARRRGKTAAAQLPYDVKTMVEDLAHIAADKAASAGETVSSVVKALVKQRPEVKLSPSSVLDIANRAEQILKEADIPLPKAKELPGGVAMANSVTNTVKKLIGEDIYLGTDPQTIEQWAAAAEKAGYTTAEGAHQIAKDILSIVKPWKRSLTPEETIGMATALDGLVAKFDDMSKKYLESATKGGDLAQSEALDLVRQQITDIVQASNKAGAEWARSGMARQAIMKADNSAAGIIARRHKQLERELTEDEIADAVADAEALKKVVDEQKVHIATLEREQADRAYRRYLNELRAKGPRSSDQVKEIDARIKDVGARIKEKWAAAAYPPEDKGGLLMAFSPLSPERLSQLAAVAPDVKELIDLYVKKGFTSAKEHIAEVIKALKQFTGQEFSEDDILAIALGKAKAAAEKVDRPKTAKELFDAEARAMWNDAAKEHSERVRYITQREREVVRKYQGAQREQELALLRRERESLKAEEAARKEAERKFYASQKAEKASEALDAKNRAAAARVQAQVSERASKAADAAEYKAAKEAEQFANSAEKQAAKEQAAKEAKAAREEMMADAKDAREAEAFYKGVVRDEQKAFNKKQLEQARGERKASMLRWKASVQGDRAAAMNRIERLNKKIEHFDKAGQILGAKSDLPKPLDDTLQKLKLEEAALRNKMAQKEAQAQAQDAYDRMPEWRKTFKAYNPWTLTRSVVASTDNSFLMNQGGMALFSDPKSWARGAGSSFRSITAKGYDNVMAEIRADKEWYEKAEGAGLFEGNANLQDIYGTDVISKIPGVGNSQTMYEGGSNALRFDMFKSWASMAEAGGKTLDVADYKAIAKEVKTWTGQGAWGKNVQSLSKPFFALRYRLSQFETALGAPLLRTFKHGMETGNYGPFQVIAKKYAQGYGTMAVTAGLTNQALAAFGPKDSSGKPMLQLDLDPRSTNFGRLVRRVNGRTSMTWDILPPQLRTIGLMAKIGLGEKITTSGNELDSSEYKNKDLREAEIGRYATNGLHPVLAAMWAYAKGSDSKDKMYFNKSQDFSGSQAWKDLAWGFAPISVQTVKEIWDNKDLSFAEKLIGIVTAPLINTGVQEQKRSGGKKKSGPSFGGAPKGGGFKKVSFAGAP